MAQVEATKPQAVGGSKLSAEAESFVPAKFRGGGDGGSMEQLGGPMSQQQLSNLPRYMTNCYPFVTEQGTVHTRPQVPWQGRPTMTGGFPAQRMPIPNSGTFPMSNGHGANHPAFSGRASLPRPQVFVQRTQYTAAPAPSPQPVIPGTGQNLAFYSHLQPHGPGPGPGPSPGHVHQPHPHPPWSHAPQPSPPFTHGSQYTPGFYPLATPLSAGGGDATNMTRVEKLKEHKGKKKRDNMVSIGIQNECSKHTGVTSKKKAKTRTLILMDAALQTDFSDEIANCTLAEQPNSLYKSGSWQESCEGDSSSEEEEVDSDSGYSSPMHRRNQACNGTHPATGLYIAQEGMVAAVPNNTCPFHGTTTSLSYTTSYVHGLNPCLVSSTQPGQPLPAVDGLDMLATPRLSYSAVASGAAPGGVHCWAKTPVISPLALNSHPQPTPKVLSGLAKTDPEEMDTTSSGGRKKRRKSKRKKRKALSGDDLGALSDDHMELYRAQSSGSVSRTSGGEDVMLHVEDEEEFPDLGGAAHHLGSIKAALAPVLSYSDALKAAGPSQGPSTVANTRPASTSFLGSVPNENLSPAMLSLLQEVWKPTPGKSLQLERLRELLLQASPEDLRGVSAEHLLEELGKLSRSHRKRQKRREAVNRKAEEELAEISLEQQVLRELSTKHQRVKEKQPAPSGGGGGKRSQQAMVLNFADILQASEKKSTASASERTETKTSSKDNGVVANILDSSAPTLRRGKEREIPKSKKPSPLKKVILKEREEKKRIRLMVDTGMEGSGSESCTTQTYPTNEEQDLSQDDQSCRCTGLDPEDESVSAALEADEEMESSDEEEDSESDEGPASPVTVVISDAETVAAAAASASHATSSVETETSASQQPTTPNPALNRRLFRYPKLDGWVFPYTLVASESDPSHDGGSSKASSAEQGACTPLSADMSPISQTSPISMSPLSPGGSPLSSGITSPTANSMAPDDARRPSVLMRIHSRRFREYCTQVLDEEIDASCTALLQDLVRFQDRLYHKDPIKAKSRRRIVLGLREVTKHLKLNKIRCVIISPNLERIQSKGGLDDALNNIIQTCESQNVPCVFALGRRALGRACAKLVPVSVVGVFNYEGSEENFNKLMALTERARQAYHEMVCVMEKEVHEFQRLAGSNSIPALYSHLGHSRTPSACSAISFTSSILSEPISENYPHSEPETDSRGYEISKPVSAATEAAADEGLDATKLTVSSSEGRESPHSSSTSQGKNVIIENLYDNEADDEADDEDNVHSQYGRSSSCIDEDLEGDRDTLPGLPHIDSIHSSVADLSTEIMSQHSSKTLDLTTEALSTHSSRTKGETGAAPTEPATGEHSPSADVSAEVCEPICNGNPPGKLKSLDKERIELWVAETKQQLERLSLAAPDTPPSANPASVPPMCATHQLDSSAVSGLVDYDNKAISCCSVRDMKQS